MKEVFKAARYQVRPRDWEAHLGDNLWLDPAHLLFDPAWEDQFYYVVGEGYQCIEFKRHINVFTFGKFSLKLPFTMIALPVSIDGCGYDGSLEALIKDYTKRKGLMMLLNIRSSQDMKGRVPFGKTLGNCLFHNPFTSFEGYLSALRSPYRRRIKLALEKINPIRIDKIVNHTFDDPLYQLYLEVLHKSQYPLETLPIDFFKEAKEDIYVFYENQLPIAFVMVKAHDHQGYFLFGGMAYNKRDTYDLYYNMLILMIKWGIEKNLATISFGQTAESSKCRLGCEIEPRYMSVFTKYPWVNSLLGLVMPLLEYKEDGKQYHVFK